jgi:hypothetical protein
VLRKLGELTATKGGPEARKDAGARTPLSGEERNWLEQTAKRLILRAAEVAFDPKASLPKITMADLPAL